MPFVEQEHRDKPDATIPGDRCYIIYKQMVDEWKKEPRWTTADKIYRHTLAYSHSASIEWKAAAELSWQVFFQLYVMPYEIKKRESNGDI